ncbi:MAG: CapA family protein [Patescibacteria group bacterium]
MTLPKGVNWTLFLLLAIILISAGVWYAIKPAVESVKKAAVNMETITVIVGGDVNLGRQTGKKIIAGEIDYPFAKIADTLKSADITFVNLESQLADLGGETQSPTSEYRFAGPPEGAQSLANAGIDIVSLANNHMWDYGKARLEETMKALTAMNVKYVGANMDTEKVWEPVITEIKGKKIAWLAMTNLLNGYENAGADKYVAFQNGSKLIEEIQKVKDSVDWVFVSLHSGAEYVENPSATLVKMSQELIDAGADVILAGHPHVPQRIEQYTAGSSNLSHADDNQGSPSFAKASEGQRVGIIFYSLGNFAFWQPFSFWTQNSFLAKFTLTKPHEVAYEIIPVKAGWQPELLTDEKMIEQLYSRLNPVSPSP